MRLLAVVSFLVLALGAAVTSAVQAHTPSPDPQTALFVTPRVDRLADGRVVLSFDTIGGLRGVLTFDLRGSEANGYSGTWAFMVSHHDYSNPTTGDDVPHDHGGGTQLHQEHLRVIQLGSLRGAVTTANLTFGADGALVDFVVPSLTISGGTLEFAGVHGHGSATLNALSLFF